MKVDVLETNPLEVVEVGVAFATAGGGSNVIVVDGVAPTTASSRYTSGSADIPLSATGYAIQFWIQQLANQPAGSDAVVLDCSGLSVRVFGGDPQITAVVDLSPSGQVFPQLNLSGETGSTTPPMHRFGHWTVVSLIVTVDGGDTTARLVGGGGYGNEVTDTGAPVTTSGAFSYAGDGSEHWSIGRLGGFAYYEGEPTFEQVVRSQIAWMEAGDAVDDGIVAWTQGFTGASAGATWNRAFGTGSAITMTESGTLTKASYEGFR